MKYRKVIRIRNYDYKTNGYYFVTICTAMKKPWLEKYKVEAETLLKDMPKRFPGVTIDFYSIASDHLHAIFVLNKAKVRLGDIVRTFKALVTKSTGCKPFWEWNYYEHTVRDEKALDNIRKYIQENPLKETIDWKHIYSGINATATKHSSAAIYRTSQGAAIYPKPGSGAIYRTPKGVALIIVIFAMMLFAVLGWTLANLQSGDFEINLRNLDSERALGLAEAGTQWALNQLSQNASWRTSADIVCNITVGSDWSAQNLNASPGQYNIYVCCRPPQATESGDAVIESIGYAPYQSSYQAMRQVKVAVSLGGLTNAVMTQPADPDVANKGLLNWWPARQSHTIQIEGNVYTGHYDGDGDAAYDEAGQDYDDQPAPILPQDSVSPSDERRNFTTSYPSIDMLWFYNNASPANRWPNPSTTTLIATITNVVNGGVNPGYIEVSVNNFFPGMNNQAIRLNVAGWHTDDNNWRAINQVVAGFSGRRARLDQAVTWPIGSSVKLMRRFYQNTSGGGNGINYIGGQIAGGTDADTLIDLRNGDIRLTNLYLICEGDIVIKGTRKLQIRFTGGSGTPRYPTLATKNGDIISTDIPQGANDAERVQQRRITGLIYSEFGHINLNYLEPLQTGSASFRGNLVYGYRITLDGQIDITFLPNLVTSNNGSFVFAPGMLEWREQ